MRVCIVIIVVAVRVRVRVRGVVRVNGVGRVWVGHDARGRIAAHYHLSVYALSSM